MKNKLTDFRLMFSSLTQNFLACVILNVYVLCRWFR